VRLDGRSYFCCLQEEPRLHHWTTLPVQHRLSFICLVHINSSDPLSPPINDPKCFGHEFDVVFHAITTAWLRKWMHTESISELLVNENVPGEDRVKTFEDWVGYTHSNAIPCSRLSIPSEERPRSRRSTCVVSSRPTLKCIVRPTCGSSTRASSHSPSPSHRLRQSTRSRKRPQT